MNDFRELPRNLRDETASADQERAIRQTLRCLKLVYDSDRPALVADSGRNDFQEELFALGSRSSIILGERGMGKTSIMVTLRHRLSNDPDRWFLPLWPPVDARALDRSDRVLLVLLNQLKESFRTVEDLHNNDEMERCARPAAPFDWGSIEEKALRSHSEFNDFVKMSSATVTEYTDRLLRQTSGTAELRSLLKRAVREGLQSIWRRSSDHESNRKRQQFPLIVFFLDDLDLAQGRAFETILDLERYLTVPGVSFVFGARYATLWHEIRGGLIAHHHGRKVSARSDFQRDGIPDIDTLYNSEADYFLNRVYPSDCRSDLRDWKPQRRVGFDLGGGRLVDRLQQALPRRFQPIFFRPDEHPSVRGPRAGLGCTQHVDILPKSPRQLRAFYQELFSLQLRGGHLRGSTMHFLEVLLSMARSTDHWAAIEFWDDILVGARDFRANPREYPPGDAQSEQALQEAIVGTLYRRLPRLTELIDSRLSVTSRELVSGEYARLQLFDHESARTQTTLPPDWVELVADIAMALDEEAINKVFERLGLYDVLDNLITWDIGDVRDEKLELRAQYVTTITGPQGHDKFQLSLAKYLRSSVSPAYPPTVRQQLRYLNSLHAAARSLDRAEALTTDDDGYLRHELQLPLLKNITIAHITACLEARGILVPPTPEGDVDPLLALAHMLRYRLELEKGRWAEVDLPWHGLPELVAFVESVWFQAQVDPPTKKMWGELCGLLQPVS